MKFADSAHREPRWIARVRVEANEEVSSMIRVLILSVVIAAPASAQIPDAFTNLQFFPKDIERGELIGAMRRFSFSLGVRCQHCHAGGPSFDDMDFASDDKREKRTARRMLSMVRDINQDHLSGVERADRLNVSCATCHRGISRPESIESIVQRELETSGLETAVARYRELRAEFHGSASYDFSESPLNQLAEALMRAGDAQLAVNLLELNAEYHDDATWLIGLLGEAHLANGDRAAARRAFERVLELDPESTSAKRKLEELSQN